VSEQASNQFPFGALAAWGVAASIVGLASDLAQPLGPVALVLFFIFAGATPLLFCVSLIPAFAAPMRAASLFAFVGALVFGGIVALQYASAGEAGRERGFVAASVPAVAQEQGRFLGLEGPDPAPAPGSELAAAATPPGLQSPAALPSIEPGVMRSGEFAARVEQAALYWDGGGSSDANASVSLTLHNMSASPVLVAVLDGPSFSMALSNGLVLDANASSIARCERHACSYGRMTRIDPGAWAGVNLTLSGRLYDGGEAATNPTPLQGNLSGRILSVDVDPSVEQTGYVSSSANARVIQVGFPNLPIAVAGASQATQGVQP
jgi:hypothetical protein